jgi:outer membrane receptor protein involved in Fe transport
MFADHTQWKRPCTSARINLPRASRALFAGAMLASGAAMAQQTDASQPATAKPSATELGNVTVTAQSRAQEVQDVPIAIAGNYTWHGVFNGSVTFDATYGIRGPMRCNAASIYQGKCSLPTNFDLNSPQKRADLRLDWNAASGRWGVGAFANNLFDQRYVEGLGTVSQSVLGTPYAYITPPRMWGVEARVKF